MTNRLLTTIVFPGADPVLLIHGFTSDGTRDFVETGIVTALADAGRGAIVVDLPGHGQGPSLERGGARTSDLALALAEAAGGASFDVIGYSLGARLAWAVAACGGVCRLVLGGLGAMDPFAGIDADALTEVVAGRSAPADPMQGMFAQMLGAPGLDAGSVIALMEGLGAEPFDPARDVPSVPTLALVGMDDPMSQGIDQIVAAMPHGRLQRVPGDHLAALRSPGFREAAVDFVTR